MSERDYTETEINEQLRDLCKSRGKRITKLEAKLAEVAELPDKWRTVDHLTWCSLDCADELRAIIDK